MSTRNLTFSLTSLILIFALGIVVTPVMAQAPAVLRFDPYVGVRNPQNAPASQVDHVQTRNSFKVRVTFNQDIQGSGSAGAFVDGDFTYLTKTDGTWNSPEVAVPAANVTGIYESTDAQNNVVLSKREFVVTLPPLAATANAAGLELTEVAVAIGANRIRGVTTPKLVPVVTSDGLSLPPISISYNTADPPVIQGAVATAASFGTPAAVAGTAGSFTVDLVLTMVGVPTSSTGVVDLSNVGEAGGLDFLFNLTPDPDTTQNITLTPVSGNDTNPTIAEATRTYSLTVASVPHNSVVQLTLPATYVGVTATQSVPIAFPAPTNVVATADTARGTVDVTWNWDKAAAEKLPGYEDGNHAGFKVEWTNPYGMIDLDPTAGSYTIPASELTLGRATTVEVSAIASNDSKILSSVATAAAPVTPMDTAPPTLTITPPDNADSNGKLLFTFDFNEKIVEPAQQDPFEISRSTSNVELLDGGPEADANNPVTNAAGDMVYRYTLLVTPIAGSTSSTVVVLRLSATDVNGLQLASDVRAVYTPTTPPGDTTKPTVTIALAGTAMYVNCDTGNELNITAADNTGGTGLASGANGAVAASEVSASTGWQIVAKGADEDIWLVPKTDGSAMGVTEVTVTVAANAVKDQATPSANGNAATQLKLTVGPVLTIPAASYILVNHPAHKLTSHLEDPLVVGSLPIRAPEVRIQSWDCMPDLTIFFGLTSPGIGGGALVVKESPENDSATNPVPVGSVGITEIMWASDEGIQHGGAVDPSTGRRSRTNYDQTREQWIELHNINGHEVKVTLFAYPTNSAININKSGEIDRVSNYNIAIASRNVWEVPGQSGNSEYGDDFVSMQRAQGKPYNHGDVSGTNKGKWSKSTYTYLTARAGLAYTGQLPQDNLNYDFRGTPGRSNSLAPDKLPTKTSISQKVIFNEVANRRDQTLEWIELKNKSGGDIDLRNYEISLVTGVGTETRFFHFNYGDNHVVMKNGELLLLVDTDPRYDDDHPLAVGYNVRGGTDQALGIGTDAPRYLVTDFVEGGLPDNGEFMLVLRTSKSDEGYENKKGTADRVSDIVGYHPNLRKDADYTLLWPLKLFGAPNAHNKILLEKVYRRQNLNDPTNVKDNKAGNAALGAVGYTGIGYKRHAQRVSENGGTPGYEHGWASTSSATTGKVGQLTISEIMLDQGDGRYPQWIEIYNHSNTPVRLHDDNGWRLVIQNYDDGEIPVGRLSGTLHFKKSDVQTILPHQTVMVTSTRARSSGSAFFDTSVVFPPTRVFSVWDDDRGALSQDRSTDPILSAEGFYIELIDGKGNVSDSIGNLSTSPNRRIAHTKEWELSEIVGSTKHAKDPDMGRSSIMRRYRKPPKNTPPGSDFRDLNDTDNDENHDEVAWPKYSPAELYTMGIMPDGWILASQTGFRDVSETWYGDRSDISSPGISTGRVLPVELATFRPQRLDDDSVVIRWITESEKDNAGFNILRSESRTGEFTKLNTQLIAGKGTTSERTPYEFVDKTAKPNVVYYYQIQDVSLDGDIQTLAVTHLRGHVSAAGKLTTTWGGLKALQ